MPVLETIAVVMEHILDLITEPSMKYSGGEGKLQVS